MQRFRLDQMAIILSSLCMIHCIASVVGLFAIGLLSAFGRMEEAFHMTMLAIIVPVSVVAIVAGYRRHRRLLVLVPGGLALVALSLLTVFEERLHGSLWEPLLTSLVGICLVITHVANIRTCKDCDVSHGEVSNEESSPA
ncbi:MerC domain-containing protein [Alcanivorax sp.]|jgi:hypothetical protein|uniref:MerC domain-containing protein n=1 Tax=Alcanivorax sp. TaxID=1872427 RepID=UPI0032D92A3C